MRVKAVVFGIVLGLCGPISFVSAHGLPTMCKAAMDAEAQCGPDHTCDVRMEVSSEIGVCQEFDTTFETCDRRKGNEDCQDGYLCLIGEVDPNIGACLVDNSPKPMPQTPTTDDEDGGCAQAAPVHRPVGWGVFLCILGLGLLRRRR